MMRVSVVSDLHLEFADCTLPGGEILILAGDIWTVRHMAAHGNPELRLRYVRFCQEELSKYAVVMVITGNHESYGFLWNDMDATLRGFLSAHAPKAILLNNQIATVGDTVFLGTPLWATCGVGKPGIEMAIGGGMNDFNLIRIKPSGADERDRRFLPRDANHLHLQAIAWLEHELPQHSKCVVIGHHAPSFKSAGRGDRALDRAYCSNQDALIKAYPQIKLWIHGHTHAREDYMIGSTRIVANPRGYFPDERVSRFFDPTSADFDLGEI